MVKIIEAQPNDYNRLLRTWQCVLRDLDVAGHSVIRASLIDSELDRVEDGALVLRVATETAAKLFQRPNYAPVVSQAIYKATGLHCGVRTYWAGAAKGCDAP